MNGKGDRDRTKNPKRFKANMAKIEKVIDWDYRNHIKEQPCLCGSECFGGIDPHHVRTRGAGGRDKSNLVPLCRKHHTELHTIGRYTFEDKYKLGDLQMRAERLYETYTRT